MIVIGKSHYSLFFLSTTLYYHITVLFFKRCATYGCSHPCFLQCTYFLCLFLYQKPVIKHAKKMPQSKPKKPTKPRPTTTAKPTQSLQHLKHMKGRIYLDLVDLTIK